MLPQYERLDGRRSPWRIPFRRVAVLTVSMPLCGFLFCVIWSVTYFFERATATHCSVRNYLPSISAAIGNYQPQRIIWQLLILIHAPGRFYALSNYHNLYNNSVQRKYQGYARFACILHLIENISLIVLSIYTSSEDYEIHKISFITFIATSEVYMMVSFVINRYFRKDWDANDPILRRSVRMKFIFCVINIISFIMAGYFFHRHNALCEPGIYTLFALTEYIVVLTNMGFHMTAYYDFYDKKVECNCSNGLTIT